MAITISIEIDFDVHKRIELERHGFSDPPNAALRRLLGIDSTPAATSPSPRAQRLWSGKGVTLPHGTELRMEYNGRVHCGRIEDGIWLVEGAQYGSPSAAAGGVARTRKGHPTSLDGWLYWRVRVPGQSQWTSLRALRNLTSTRHNTATSAMLARKRAGNLRRPTGDLPAESNVIAELESFLAETKRPVSLSETYTALADRFQLTHEQRTRLMPNGKDVHWENRVRFARRKLVDRGVFDLTLPRGKWGLTLVE